MNRFAWPLIGLALWLPLATGCVPLVVGGVAAGAMVAHDRRTSGAIIEDQQIELRAFQELRNQPEIADRSHISVTSYNLTTLLTGEAESEDVSRKAAILVSQMPHVRAVYNEVRTADDANLWDETEDTYLTSKVKLSLIDVEVEGFDPTFVKIVTSQNDVFLMGLVTREEGQAVIEKVRGLSGVNRVVEIFEFIEH